MNLKYRLAWAKGPLAAKQFKTGASFALFSEYLERTRRFVPVSCSGIDLARPEKGPVRWFCHPSKDTRPFSSEALARALERLRQGAVRDWEIVVGPADGFTDAQIDAWNPAMLWSFGPLTLPHELAAVVASEQIYRAFTILAGQPYHAGH